MREILPFFSFFFLKKNFFFLTRFLSFFSSFYSCVFVCLCALLRLLTLSLIRDSLIIYI